MRTMTIPRIALALSTAVAVLAVTTPADRQMVTIAKCQSTHDGVTYVLLASIIAVNGDENALSGPYGFNCAQRSADEDTEVDSRGLTLRHVTFVP